MKKLNLEQMEKIEGGKFWGTECDYNNELEYHLEYGTHYADGTPDPYSLYEWCLYPCYYYVLGINTGQNGTTCGPCK